MLRPGFPTVFGASALSPSSHPDRPQVTGVYWSKLSGIHPLPASSPEGACRNRTAVSTCWGCIMSNQSHHEPELCSALLTFCPPGPAERENVSSRSFRLTPNSSSCLIFPSYGTYMCGFHSSIRRSHCQVAGWIFQLMAQHAQHSTALQRADTSLG